MTVRIWHNPRCSKSRQTLELLQANGINPEVRLYLKDAPSADELREALAALDKPASAIIRNGEEAYRTAGLGPDSSNAELIASMVETPKLIERPIVFNGDKAEIGRPPEAVLKLFI